MFSRVLYMSVAHILVVPLSDASFVCQKVKIPVESLKVADKVVFDVTRSTFFKEGTPVFIIISQISVQNVIYKLGKPKNEFINHKDI